MLVKGYARLTYLSFKFFEEFQSFALNNWFTLQVLYVVQISSPDGRNHIWKNRLVLCCTQNTKWPVWAFLKYFRISPEIILFHKWFQQCISYLKFIKCTRSSVYLPRSRANVWDFSSAYWKSQSLTTEDYLTFLLIETFR